MVLTGTLCFKRASKFSSCNSPMGPTLLSHLPHLVLLSFPLFISFSYSFFPYKNNGADNLSFSLSLSKAVFIFIFLVGLLGLFEIWKTKREEEEEGEEYESVLVKKKKVAFFFILDVVNRGSWRVWSKKIKNKNRNKACFFFVSCMSNLHGF